MQINGINNNQNFTGMLCYTVQKKDRPLFRGEPYGPKTEEKAIDTNVITHMKERDDGNNVKHTFIYLLSRDKNDKSCILVEAPLKHVVEAYNKASGLESSHLGKAAEFDGWDRH